MFGIISARNFREKAARDSAALQSDVANADLAINAVLSAYHLHEWVRGLVLKPRKPAFVRASTIRSKTEWVGWLEASCPHFLLLQELANGSKHCVPVANAEKIEGYGRGPYGIGPYGKPYLLIDMGNEVAPEKRWRVGHRVVREANEFWAELDAELDFSTNSAVDPQIAGTK